MKYFAARVLSVLLISSVYAADVPIRPFPLNEYNQCVDYWVNPSSASYDPPLVTLTYQKQR